MVRSTCLMLLAAVVLAACGGDSPSPTPPPTPSQDVDENGITTKGLAVRYKFDNDLKETTGSGLDGTPHTDVTYVDGRHSKAGKAVRFNGYAGYVTVTGSKMNLLEPEDAFTFSFWINAYKASGYDQWAHIIAKSNNFGNGYVFKWTHDGNKNLDAFLVYGANGTSTPNDRLTIPNLPYIGTWTHVCYTWSKSAGLFVLYINGVAAGAVVNSRYRGEHSGNTMYIGGQPYTMPNGEIIDRTIPAAIDDLRIYNRALSNDEIYALSREGAN